MRLKHVRTIILFTILVFTNACHKQPFNTSLFESIPSNQSHITFINQLQSTEEFNTYTFRNFYNGAGVALGDVNNDGLLDIYFCGNSVDNQLYLNKGNWQFEDVTEKAGVACKNVWSTGASMADVNGDGWLDIYVCKSGLPGGENRYNQLFINNQDGTFTESAKIWGIADEGLSVHAVFFDYDKDGDLDMYLLNNSLRSIGTGSDLNQQNRNVRDPNGGNKLYRNESDHFVQVSEQAGIYSSTIGFGLGVTIGDVNRDGWQDIYVSNDFFEKDYLYINQQNGTFKEDLENWMREISMGSMGADMADLTNDGFPEIFVTEMLPASDDRYKTKVQFEDWNTYQRKVQQGFYHQFGRNVLQLNNGDSTFSEIGRLAGVEATDWSWGALIFDMDGDGWKDLFVANGIYKDLLDQDYVNFYSNPERVRQLIKTEEQAILKLIDAMPSEALPNYAFANQRNLTFPNRAVEWGLGTPSFSNGSAYGDLDNDGDLDLVVNNVNMPPFLYQNHAKEQLGHYTLSIALVGESKNTFGLGAQVTVYAAGQRFYQELAPMRGFQSCVDHRLHFGLGKTSQIDSIVVRWNSGKVSKLTNVAANQLLTVYEKEAQVTNFSGTEPSVATIFQPIAKGIDFKHQENEFSDFDRDRLLIQMFSTEGPKMAKADVNGDGLEDVYIGGAKDASGALFVQKKDGSLFATNQSLFERDKISEDTDCLFFDADGDGDQDLYVASGGNEFPNSAAALLDRLYFNDGEGNFTKSPQLLPSTQFESSSCVKASDVDRDGDLDLFVGIRLRPFAYGMPASSYLLLNDGKGQFQDATKMMAPDLMNLGLVTDALWLDMDNDSDDDLVIAGEWMPITILKNENGKLQKDTSNAAMQKVSGFWHCLKAADLDKDGDLDFVAGNLGLNSRLRIRENQSISLYVNDFDKNGSIEQILTLDKEEQALPFLQRTDLVMQIPELKKKYLKFNDYKGQTLQNIFSAQQFNKITHLRVTETRTMVFINNGKQGFETKALPIQAQMSPIYAIVINDFDRDGHLDILLGGNFYQSKPEFGIYDATYGVFLKGDEKMNFTFVPSTQSGLKIKGAIRDFETLAGKWLFVGKNDDAVEVFVY